MIRISLDSERAKWLKAAEELPLTFLFDNKGILIAMNPTE
jgi:hypothetical protein